MPKLFLSYRREDTLPIVGRIYDRLSNHFGKEFVFLDYDAIPIGADFRNYIKESLNDCDVLLAIIGKNWIAKTKQRISRLNNPADFVRLELEIALANNIPIIPILVAGATIPEKNELPDVLEPLIYIQASVVDIGRDFNSHITHLIDGIENLANQQMSGTKNIAIANTSVNDFNLASKETRGHIQFTYYVGVESAISPAPGMLPPLEALCIAPFGMKKGTEAEIIGDDFGLVVGETVRIRFFKSSVRRDDLPGTMLKDWSPGELEELKEIEATLTADNHKVGEIIPVRLKAVVSPMGALKLEAIPHSGSTKWHIEAL